MNLRHLRYFLAVAEELNFTRAAERLAMAQPPLSRQIRDLEDEVGAALLERTGHRLRLTPAGLALRDEAYAILGRCDSALALTRAVAKGDTGTLTIGYMPVAFCHAPFVRALKNFRLQFPNIQLALVQMAPARQRQAILAREIDFGIMHIQTAMNAEYERLRIHDEAIELALPEDHHLLHHPQLTLAGIEQEPIIMMVRQWCPIFYDRCIQLWRRQGLEPQIVQETESYAVSLSLVAMGVGLTLSSPALRAHFNIAVATRPLADVEIRMGADLVWLRRAVSPSMRHFLAAMHHECESP